MIPLTSSSRPSVGELIDKITILRIKSARFHDAAKLHNVNCELALLEQTFARGGHRFQRLSIT